MVEVGEFYDVEVDKVPEGNYSHLNVEGLSLWYQMTNKPDFYMTF